MFIQERAMDGLVRKGWFGNLVLLVLALSLFEHCDCEGKGYPLAPNCANVECPIYEVIESQKDFEIRSYKEAMWVSSPIINSTNSFKLASTRGFSILFAYINGLNKQSAIISITAPILINIYPPSQPSGNSTFAVNFYLPQNYQNNPPELEYIRLVKLPEQPYAAVRRFCGPTNDDNVPVEAAALKESLKGTPWEVATTVKNYAIAVYNSPFDVENRVNEVIYWFDKPFDLENHSCYDSLNNPTM